VYVYWELVETNLLPLSNMTPSYRKVPNTHGWFCLSKVTSQGMLTPIVAMVLEHIVFLEDSTMCLYPSPVHRILPNV